MKELLKKILPQPAVKWLVHVVASAGGTYLQFSYSQEGEDLILERILGDRKSGFYVDVGAHHPRRFSNTRRFYKRGWHGINIEPNPDALKLFQRQRTRDINLGYGVADTETELTYFMFNEPALNSFDRVLSEQRQSGKYRITGTKQIPVKRLSKLLAEFLPPNAHIDFMSIDVEGFDLQVLQSNDWTRFRPTCVLVESESFDLGNPGVSPIHGFLEKQNYTLFAKTFNTLFYLDRTRMNS
jgi:FkbM family methyltransferase